MTQHNVLLIANFLSMGTGGKSISEEMVDRLRISSDWNILTTSSHPGRVRRLADFIITILRERQNYDIVNIEVYSTLAFVWAEISAQLLFLLQKPFILALHGGGLPLLAKRSPRRVRHLLSVANAVTTPSRYIQQALKPFRDDIYYLPNGLNLENYPFKLRVDPGPKLCWLRAFHEIYNPCMAIEVIANLQKLFPNVHLTMIGPDKSDGTFEQVLKMIKDGNLENHVDIVGAIPKTEVPSWLQKYDVYINTTRLESFGVAVMEAAAMGLPIVTTDVGELSYLWSNGEDALLVPQNDSDAMAKAVQRILTEPGLAEKLSRNARRKAEKFDWSVILPQWEQLVDQVLEAN